MGRKGIAALMVLCCCLAVEMISCQNKKEGDKNIVYNTPGNNNSDGNTVEFGGMTWSQANLSADSNVLDYSAVETQKSLSITNTGTEDMSVQVKGAEPWINVTLSGNTVPAEVYGSTENKATVNVTVDRSKIVPGANDCTVDGECSGNIEVVTDGGVQSVWVTLSQKVSGVYAGVVTVTDPYALGNLDLSLNLLRDGNTISGYVDQNSSLLFPTQDAIEGTISGTEINLNFIVYHPASQPLNPFPSRNIVRHINLQGELTGANKFQGHYTEEIDGIFPNPMEIRGEFFLFRTGDPRDPGFIPQHPIVAGNTWTNSCDPTDPELIDNLVTLGGDSLQAAVPYLDPLTDYEKFLTGVSYDIFLQDECNTLGLPYCWSASAFTNAENYFQRAYCKNPLYEDANRGLLDTYWQRSRIDMLHGNDWLVKAEDRLKEDPATINEILAEHPEWASDCLLDEDICLLRAAEEDFSGVAERFFDHIQFFDAVSSNLLVERIYKDFDVVVKASSRDSLAGSELAKWYFRQGDAHLVEARDVIQKDSLKTYLEGSALAYMFWARDVPYMDEFGDYRNSLEDFHKQLEIINNGLNPLGYSSDYYPFYFRPENVATNNTNNFEQLYNLTWNYPLSLASSDENALTSISRQYDNNKQALINEVDADRVNYESQLGSLCGFDASLKPDLEHCGQQSGEIYQSIQNVSVASQRIELNYQKIENVYAAAKIDFDLMQKLDVLTDEIVMVYKNTAEQEVVLINMEAELERERNRASFWGNFGASIFNFAAQAIGAVFTGGWSLVATAGVDIITNQTGKLYQWDQEFNFINTEEEIKARRVRLEAMRDGQIEILHGKQHNAEIEARIKERYLSLSELELEQSILELQLAQEWARLKQLINQKNYVQSEYQKAIYLDFDSSYNDPAYRLLRDELSVQAEQSFEWGLKYTYLTGKALEYETNETYAPLKDLFKIKKAGNMTDHPENSCAPDTLCHFMLDMWVYYAEYRARVGNPQSRQDVISLRDDILGFKDWATVPTNTSCTSGANCSSLCTDYSSYDCTASCNLTTKKCEMTWSPRRQFQNYIMDPHQRDKDGNLRIMFTTSISQGNPLFSSNSFNDRINYVKINLVGTKLGDAQAVVYLDQRGTSFIRNWRAFGETGIDEIRDYNLRPWRASISSRVNNVTSLPPEVEQNRELYGRSIAFTEWQLTIDKLREPQNWDIDLSSLEDIEITVLHDAYTLQEWSE